mgnify:CR=1 FL=1
MENTSASFSFGSSANDKSPSFVARAIHRFFHDRGFYWVNTPIITSADAEGAGALFRVIVREDPAHPGRAFGALLLLSGPLMLCGLGEIFLSQGDAQAALFVFQAALRVNPHLDSARSKVSRSSSCFGW